MTPFDEDEYLDANRSHGTQAKDTETAGRRRPAENGWYTNAKPPRVSSGASYAMPTAATGRAKNFDAERFRSRPPGLSDHCHVRSDPENAIEGVQNGRSEGIDRRDL